MQALTLRTIKAEGHPEAKMMFWNLFGTLRGGKNRIKIISLIKNRPQNTNQLSAELKLDYKAVSHHLKILEENSIITKMGDGYGTCYFTSPLFEANQQIFDEIVTKLN